MNHSGAANSGESNVFQNEAKYAPKGALLQL